MSIQFFAPRGADNQIVKLPSTLRRTVRWLPQIGDIFPDFNVETTAGPLNFWKWAEGHWVHLFSHPAANTPVCTTEIASIASYSAAWKTANVKNLALTGSTIEEQEQWHDDIARLFNVDVDFPCAQDTGLRLSKLFGMMHEKEADTYPIRKSFLIDPSMRLRMIFEYPVFIGRRTDEILRVLQALQMRDRTGAATPSDWEEGDITLIPDDRPEAHVWRDFGANSTRLSPYLRVVQPTD